MHKLSIDAFKEKKKNFKRKIENFKRMTILQQNIINL